VAASWSRNLLVAELLCLCLPAVLLMPVFAWLNVEIGDTAEERSTVLVWTSILFSAGFICIASGLRIALRFVVGGVGALRSSPRYLWRLAHIGAALCALGIGAFCVPWELVVAVPPDSILPPPIPQFRGLSLAIPLLVPYCHLL